MPPPPLAQTEAELQGRFEAAVRKVFPLLAAEFRLERFLYLKLGHHDLKLDALRSTPIRGRYDMLMLVGGKPVVLIELKATDVAIEEEDVKQGLSYARLHEPPVPLVLVTNGSSVELRRSYDGAKVETSDISKARIDELLTNSAVLAARDVDDAIRTLLNGTSETDEATDPDRDGALGIVLHAAPGKILVELLQKSMKPNPSATTIRHYLLDELYERGWRLRFRSRRVEVLRKGQDENGALSVTCGVG